MDETCVNCGEPGRVRRYHIYLSTEDVVELSLCEGCRYKFVTSEWVRAVI